MAALVGIKCSLWSATVPTSNDTSSRARQHEIHALSIVKKEVDILQDTLIAAVQWCDHIYVLHNGSNDGTWEL
jgi:hypothetical protein